jgi:hypothetical protein
MENAPYNLITQHVISDTARKWSFSTDEIPCCGLYSSSRYMNTLQIKLRNFVGKITVQGTIDYENKQWSTINNLEYTLPDNTLDLNLNTYRTYSRGAASSGTLTAVFYGRYSYIRILVDRDYIVSTSITNSDVDAVGSIQSILLCY